VFDLCLTQKANRSFVAFSPDRNSGQLKRIIVLSREREKKGG
jgi:hypothetical protein